MWLRPEIYQSVAQSNVAVYYDTNFICNATLRKPAMSKIYSALFARGVLRTPSKKSSLVGVTADDTHHFAKASSTTFFLFSTNNRVLNKLPHSKGLAFIIPDLGQNFSKLLQEIDKACIPHLVSSPRDDEQSKPPLFADSYHFTSIRSKSKNQITFEIVRHPNPLPL